MGPAILPLAAAHMVRSVVREAVQNALKHGQPEAISVTIRLDEDAIALTVADDGGGFDPSSVQTGNGLANMQARVTSLGGRINIASGAEGTRIEAQFPVDIVRITQ
jgi:two-component system sensor histidine kinase DevS